MIKEISCQQANKLKVTCSYLKISSSWSEDKSLSSVPWTTVALASRGFTSATGMFSRWAMSSTVSLPGNIYVKHVCYWTNLIFVSNHPI